MASSGNPKNDVVPDVSVVIPTLNRWDVLARRGLRAAVGQEGVSVEVVVVDDGSDAQPPMSPPFDDPRIVMVRHEANTGVAAARNTGIGVARGEWIAFLDDDDIWAPMKLATVVQAADRAGADFGYSSVVVVDNELRPLRVMPAPPGQGIEEALCKRNVVPAGASNVVAKASLISRSGNFDETLSTTADWEFWLRLARAGRGESVDEPMVGYRASTWVLADERQHRRDCERMAAKHREVEVDWLVHKRWIADSYLWDRQWAAGAQKHASAWLRHGDLRSLTKAGRSLLTGRRRGQVRLARSPAVADWIRLYT